VLASSTGSPLPMIIQGGMGIGVSGWRLARAVSLRGQLGVVSATAIDSVFVRRLQDGDPGGDLRRAMDHFPLPGIAAAALRRYYREGGRPPACLSHARHVSQGRRSGSRAS
jgi:NAD(P)H-dependent flavin oxidoreductase YrpB (nitropropane dioxygenase family)